MMKNNQELASSQLVALTELKSQCVPCSICKLLLQGLNIWHVKARSYNLLNYMNVNMNKIKHMTTRHSDINNVVTMCECALYVYIYIYIYTHLITAKSGITAS